VYASLLTNCRKGLLYLKQTPQGEGQKKRMEDTKLIITLKDGSKKEYAEAMSAYDIARDISEGLARAACLAEIDGETAFKPYEIHTIRFV
jgi:hypothetical protein